MTTKEKLTPAATSHTIKAVQAINSLCVRLVGDDGKTNEISRLVDDGLAVVNIILSNKGIQASVVHDDGMIQPLGAFEISEALLN